MVSEDKSLSGLNELDVPVNSLVLLVEALIRENGLLCFPDHVENVWFAIVVPVSSDSQVDLLGVFVSVESDADPKNRVWRCHGNASEDIGCIVSLLSSLQAILGSLQL